MRKVLACSYDSQRKWIPSSTLDRSVRPRRQETEPNMLKNTIESADYYPYSRKRRHDLPSCYKKDINPTKALCGASTMAVLHHAGLFFDLIFANGFLCEVKVAY